jgi:hypothetical protein
MKQGGSAWVFGGGIGPATLAAWNRGGTNANTFTDRDNELIPGRFMYDYPHWRTTVEILRLVGAAKLMWNDPKFNATSPARGNYEGAPPYGNLVANAMWLTPRSRTNPDDNPPPLRRPDSFWYATQFESDLLTTPNFIIEDVNGEVPGGEISTLDTVYTSQDAQAIYVDRPIMTFYHGLEFQKVDFENTGGGLVFEPAEFVFSGFPLWFFSRSQQVALVDFVLHDIWGLQRDVSAPRGVTQMRASAAGPARLAPQRLGGAQRLGSQRLAPQVAPLRTSGVQR